MSHSKIVQISTDPIERKDWIVDTNYYDTGFVGSVADYVADVTDDERKSNGYDFKRCFGVFDDVHGSICYRKYLWQKSGKNNCF